MSKTLVVVESPAKAKTIKKYLGPGFEVLASKGHVKDLPKKMGIDVEQGFRETYEVIDAKAKILGELKSAAKGADRLLLATDPDREGEAIAFHIAEELRRPKLAVERVEFHEITKKGVQHGLANPRALDESLYDAQRSRRVLDRIVGYDVSALVWSKLAFGLSAGRVQSVALRLIVEREREIERFVPEEYWNVGVALRGKQPERVLARLAKANGAKFEVKDGDTAQAVRADLESAAYRVAGVSKREQKRHAPAPYTTSKLQQDAGSHLRFTTKRTMNIAQKLYEGVDLKKDGGPVGLITYMRTDSVRVSNEAIAAVREHIASQFGAEFLPEKPNFYRAKKNAQEAHEAIRPTSLEYPPEHVRRHLTDEQYKLYRLIWDRFVASQMTSAIYDQTGVDIEAKPGRAGPRHASYLLRASGKVLKFAGWLAEYQRDKTGKPFGDDAPAALAGEEDAEPESSRLASAAPAEVPSLEDDADGSLPELAEGEALSLVKPPGVITEQKFTQPPPRYNEGSLVRELEKRGIGRPSTYAEIISKVQARDYVEKLPGGQMMATDLGKLVIDGLVSTHLDFMDPDFTAKMEEELDEVEAGRLDRVELLSRFYQRFREVLDRAKKDKRWTPEPEPTDFTCDECGSRLLKRWSKNGWFLGCEAYPKCKFTRNLTADGATPETPRLTDYACDKCGRPMIVKTGRFGEFLSCSDYPKCKNTRPVPLGVPCPKCGGDLVEVRSRKRGGKTFYGCGKYPECDYKVWQKPVPTPCPNCQHPFLVVGGGKKNPKLVCPRGKECGYSRPLEDLPALELEPAKAAGRGAPKEDSPVAASP
ncbi:MAG: type I DNA topoisomerase [Sorangiineae bacterium]|nr:type I DNA topoisomerase [Polyangiaceae bacterium]MEB2323467.1 type I DNA topoisomerase [Sorangiineae bacterium]